MKKREIQITIYFNFRKRATHSKKCFHMTDVKNSLIISVIHYKNIKQKKYDQIVVWKKNDDTVCPDRIYMHLKRIKANGILKNSYQ